MLRGVALVLRATALWGPGVEDDVRCAVSAAPGPEWGRSASQSGAVLPRAAAIQPRPRAASKALMQQAPARQIHTRMDTAAFESLSARLSTVPVRMSRRGIVVPSDPSAEARECPRALERRRLAAAQRRVADSPSRGLAAPGAVGSALREYAVLLQRCAVRDPGRMRGRTGEFAFSLLMLRAIDLARHAAPEGDGCADAPAHRPAHLECAEQLAAQSLCPDTERAAVRRPRRSASQKDLRARRAPSPRKCQARPNRNVSAAHSAAAGTAPQPTLADVLARFLGPAVVRQMLAHPRLSAQHRQLLGGAVSATHFAAMDEPVRYADAALHHVAGVAVDTHTYEEGMDFVLWARLPGTRAGRPRMAALTVEVKNRVKMRRCEFAGAAAALRRRTARLLPAGTPHVAMVVQVGGPVVARRRTCAAGNPVLHIDDGSPCALCASDDDALVADGELHALGSTECREELRRRCAAAPDRDKPAGDDSDPEDADDPASWDSPYSELSIDYDDGSLEEDDTSPLRQSTEGSPNDSRSDCSPPAGDSLPSPAAQNAGPEAGSPPAPPCQRTGSPAALRRSEEGTMWTERAAPADTGPRSRSLSGMDDTVGRRADNCRVARPAAKQGKCRCPGSDWASRAQDHGPWIRARAGRHGAKKRRGGWTTMRNGRPVRSTKGPRRGAQAAMPPAPPIPADAFAEDILQAIEEDGFYDAVSPGLGRRGGRSQSLHSAEAQAERVAEAQGIRVFASSDHALLITVEDALAEGVMGHLLADDERAMLRDICREFYRE